MPPQSPTAGGGPPRPEDIITALATKEGVPPQLALTIAEIESNLNFNVPDSPKGAIGIMQLMPETARRHGVDPRDQYGNILGGIRELKELRDQYGTDLTLIARRYNGSPQASRAATDPYVAKFRTIFNRRMGVPETGSGRASGAGPAATGQPRGGGPATGRASGAGPLGGRVQPPPPPPSQSLGDIVVDYGKDLVSAYDPREREGRQNIAGAVGGIGGGLLGGVAGSAGGAALFGALEQGLEETGIFGGPPPPPDSTMAGRIATAGAWQGGMDVMGTGIARGVTGAFKRIVTPSVSRTATEYFEDKKREVLDAMRWTADTLRLEEMFKSLARTRVERELGAETRGAVRKVAKEAGDARHAARTAAQGARTATARTAEQDVAAAQSASALSKGMYESAGEAAQGDLDKRFAALASDAPAETAAGQSVSEVFETHAMKAKRAYGQAIDDAADAGPDINIASLKAEAERLLREEVLPPEQAFPRRVPPTDMSPLSTPPRTPDDLPVNPSEALLRPGGIEPPKAGRMTPLPGEPPPRLSDARDQLARSPVEGGPPRLTEDPLDQLTRRVSEAEAERMVQHPALAILTRIRNAPNVVKFKEAHLWKQQLQEALRGTYDDVVRNKVTGMTDRLAGELRRLLAVDPAYNAATANYQRVAPIFEGPAAETIRRVAREEPAKIVQMLSPNDPQQARFLVGLMTEMAEQGGGEAGKRAGAQALASVQQEWLRRNVLNKGLKGLGEQVAKLRANGEFMEALFPSQEMKDVIGHLEQFAALQAQASEELAETLAQQQARGAATVAEARTAGREAKRTTQAQTRQQTRAVDEAQSARVLAEREAGEAAREAARRKTEDQAQAMSVRRLEQQQEITQRQAGTPAERQFERSTLAPGRQRKAEQVGADALNAIRQAGTHFGNVGIVRLMKGASDEDMLLYAAYSPELMQSLVRWFLWRGWAPTVSNLGVRPALGGAQPPPEPPPKVGGSGRISIERVQ
jgi:hypothetical protein